MGGFRGGTVEGNLRDTVVAANMLPAVGCVGKQERPPRVCSLKHFQSQTDGDKLGEKTGLPRSSRAWAASLVCPCYQDSFIPEMQAFLREIGTLFQGPYSVFSLKKHIDY